VVWGGRPRPPPLTLITAAGNLIQSVTEQSRRESQELES
jgi:hypothetical protein